ncbi:MAG: pentapeptide repeat-containing protein, partial [Myxococcales bacterium]|nr:pentapeptide repeat-containing protein [Myxococcales bacterium]
MTYQSTCRIAAGNLSTLLDRARRALVDQATVRSDIEVAIRHLGSWRSDPTSRDSLTALEILRARALAARLSLSEETPPEVKHALVEAVRLAEDCHELFVARLQPPPSRAPIRSGALLSRRIERDEPLSGVRVESLRLVLRAQDANFNGAHLVDLDLSGSLLRHASFSRAVLERVKLGATELHDACFDGGHLDDVDFRGTSLQRATFRDAVIRGCCFDECALDGSQWAGARLTECSFRRAHADGIDLSNALLTGSAFAAVSLAGARLQR